MSKSYVDRLIEALSPEEDYFQVHVVNNEGYAIDFPPIEFRVLRDYEEFDKAAKNGAGFAKKYEDKKLPKDVREKLDSISSNFSPETLVAAYLMNWFVKDKEEWTVYEFLKLSKSLGWVFLYLEQSYRQKQMNTLPEREVEKIEEIKKA